MDAASVMKAERRSVAAWIPAAAASAVGGVALAFALPKSNIWPLAFVGLTIFFRAWYRLGSRAAFFTGWLGGLVYFSMTFSWFGETAGALVGPAAFVIVLAPALAEGLAFGLAALLGSIALRTAPRGLAPLAVAAAFALTEAIRSAGPLGVPFGNVAYSQVVSPLAPLAAFVGSTGLTFGLCILAAYAAYALAEPFGIPALRTAGIAAVGVTAATALAWIAWPARHYPEPTTTAAAIQGNIKQEIKWSRGAFDLALARYETLTLASARRQPTLIVWPETVITTDLNLAPWLQARFARLSRATGAELVVGAKESRNGVEYNALYLFNKNGLLEQVYRKRQLVPFAETLPAAQIFGKLPYMDLVSRFGTGSDSGVFESAGLRYAPLICWESAFSELAVEGVRDGADVLVVSTDDAWFGRSAGPYQHAQISQMRALETGSWVVRAAATGISGIIAPNGRWRERTSIDEETIISGGVGPPATAPYVWIGPFAVAIGLSVVYLAILALRRRA